MIIALVSSAAFYAASFLFNFWFFPFFCFIPLFFCRFHSYKKALCAGLLWGMIGYGISLIALLDLILFLGLGWQKFLYATFFLGYFVFFVSFWFCFVKLIASFLRCWQWAWLWGTMVFFTVMATIFFYPITGSWQGYGPACPLIFLEKVPQLLFFLPVIGWCCMRFFLLLFQMGIVKKNLKLALCGLFPFVCGFFLSQVSLHFEPIDDPMKDIVVLPTFFKERLPYERMVELMSVLKKAFVSYPHARMFVFPESAFPFPLNEYPQAIALWSEAIEGKMLVMGAHYKDKELLYNSVFFFNLGRIIGRYDKKHLLPFFEMPCTKNSLVQNGHQIFMNQKEQFFPGSQNQHEKKMRKEFGCVRMCSELLWDIPKHTTVYALVHDGHYRYSYYSEVFSLFVQFQAHLKNDVLVYCSWKKGFKKYQKIKFSYT